jgi:hypothetical protein
MTKKPENCELCNKSTLSLLLLRPSPISTKNPVKPDGTDAVASDPAVMADLLPKREPTESRFVLRLLRAGYVHVYLPSPPAGMKNWMVYRVTDQADLYPDNLPLFVPAQGDIPCAREGHNTTGAKLLHLPRAHQIKELWIAYSANLWGDKLKAQNQANPKTMQRIVLSGGSPNTFKPTVANLKSKVLECALPQLTVGPSKDQDFPFNSVSTQVENLAANLERAAACHPLTKGKELAVVLRDPVGIAAELNAWRLRRQDRADHYALQPQNRQPMEVSKLISILKENVLSEADERAMEAVSPLKRKDAFDPSRLPSGTEWRALTGEERKVLQSRVPDGIVGTIFGGPYRNAFARADLGRIVYPDRDDRAESWAKQEAEKNWAKMSEFYSQEKIDAWHKDFAGRVTLLHLDPLKKFEADWAASLEDAAFFEYFALHFDEGASNSPKEVAKTGCCAGAVYTQEAVLAYLPEPFTDAGIPAFEKQLDAEMTDKKAILQRAVVANQADVIAILTQDKRDKTYDFIKGLIGEGVGKASDGGKKPLPGALAKKYAWLTDVNMFFSVGLVGALAAVAGHGVVQALQARQGMKGSASGLDPKVMSRLSKAQTMALIHRASEEALAAAVQGRAPNTPMYFVAKFDVDTARQIMRGRGQMQDIKTLRKWAKKGQVTIGFFTDTDTFARIQAEPEALTRELGAKARTVHLQEQAMVVKGKLADSAAQGAVLMTTPEKLQKFYEAHRAVAAKAPSMLTKWLVRVNGVARTNTVQAMRSTAMGMDGRLAVGSMIVQALGLKEGLAAYAKAENAEARTTAALAIADGFSGFMGGLAELAAAGLEARLLLTGGKAAADASVGLRLWRGLGYGMGAAGNAVNAVICFRDAEKLKAAGNNDLARMLRAAGYLFAAGGLPLGALAIHSVLEAAVKRGILATGVVTIETIGVMLGRRLAVGMITLSVPGIGWALTGVAVIHTVYVITNTPTAVQQWLKNCYFGKPDEEGNRRKSWEQEEAEFKKMTEVGMTDEEKKKHHQAMTKALEEAEANANIA